MSTTFKSQGICHAGKIGKAQELFNSMCDSKGKSLKIHIRMISFHHVEFANLDDASIVLIDMIFFGNESRNKSQE